VGARGKEGGLAGGGAGEEGVLAEIEGVQVCGERRDSSDNSSIP